ncbi:dihydrofolate reductase family protein [Algimonas porphyrae]|uniref:dihydrofolate reductase family protein n=1 Tax=Algimonas porphyrae TaxID=1128113 RepID=UPI00366CEF88
MGEPVTGAGMVTLTLSCAVSADGYLDDRSSERVVLSSPEDLAAVLALRAQMDMIVIGAETLRRDDPSLATRGERHRASRAAAGLSPDPVKLVVTRSGDIPHDRAFFRDGMGEKIVLSRNPTRAPGTVEPFTGDPIDAVVQLAEARHFGQVLIEGGAQILRLALSKSRYLRLAVSPRRLGDGGHARLFDDLNRFLANLHVTQTEKLGDTRIYHIDLLLSRARPHMATALRLSARCPASETAFAVGCLGCDAALNVLATGYSRETGPQDHAEEAMLTKTSEPIHTVIVTLEPCLTRASKPTGCAQWLVRAGVKRVIYAVAEDATFTRQTGLAHLASHGIEVLHLPGFEAEFRAANASIYDAS